MLRIFAPLKDSNLEWRVVRATLCPFAMHLMPDSWMGRNGDFFLAAVLEDPQDCALQFLIPVELLFPVALPARQSCMIARNRSASRSSCIFHR